MFRDSQTVIITNFVVLSDVSIKTVVFSSNTQLFNRLRVHSYSVNVHFEKNGLRFKVGKYFCSKRFRLVSYQCVMKKKTEM